MYIYIYIERERYRYRYMYIYVYTHAPDHGPAAGGVALVGAVRAEDEQEPSIRRLEVVRFVYYVL